jgi:hypothetical protein
VNAESKTENDAIAGLREVVQRIADQASCASPAGECYSDHDGCFVSESLRIAREVLARHEPPVCQRRYIVESLADASQDARMKCARIEGHDRRHRNASGDLEWDDGAEISIAAVLNGSSAQDAAYTLPDKPLNVAFTLDGIVEKSSTSPGTTGAGA